MPISWNEIKSRALTFSRTWADAANEDSQGKPFWIDFFEIFGITDKRVATFEHAVKKLPGVKARTDGFVENVASIQGTSNERLREQLVNDGVMAAQNGLLVFTRDHLFPSPSTAAMAVMGRSANDWVEWKNPQGKTLDEVKRQSVTVAS